MPATPFDTCPELVRRSTGHAATPWTRTTAMVRCGRPTTYELIAGGEVVAWSCTRHRRVLERINPGGDGFEIIKVAL